MGERELKKNYDYTAGQTSLVMGDEKSTLSVAERVKRVVLMVVSFYCLHLRTDTPEKEKEADLTDRSKTPSDRCLQSIYPPDGDG